MAAITEISEAWKQSERVVALAGAGLSTASGIPDFRSPGGRWSNYQPVTIQEFMASEASREEYWRYKGETWQVICQSDPNPGHLALKDLGVANRLQLLVTQNVDGLNDRSGFPEDRLIHIHGTDSRVECMACHRIEPRELAQREWESGTKVPHCSCGGAWKPAVVSFGQNLVMVDLERAMSSASNCDLFVAVGTSLVVGPINQMFDAARSGGAKTAILTASETPYDRAADWKLSEPLEEILPQIARLVLEE